MNNFHFGMFKKLCLNMYLSNYASGRLYVFIYSFVKSAEMFPAGRRQVISQEVDTAAVNIRCEGGMPDTVLCAVAGLRPLL